MISGNNAVAHCYYQAKCVVDVILNSDPPTYARSIAVSGTKGNSSLTAIIIDATTVNRCCIMPDGTIAEHEVAKICIVDAIVNAPTIVWSGIIRESVIG